MQLVYFIASFEGSENTRCIEGATLILCADYKQVKSSRDRNVQKLLPLLSLLTDVERGKQNLIQNGNVC